MIHWESRRATEIVEPQIGNVARDLAIILILIPCGRLGRELRGLTRCGLARLCCVGESRTFIPSFFVSLLLGGAAFCLIKTSVRYHIQWTSG